MVELVLAVIGGVVVTAAVLYVGLGVIAIALFERAMRGPRRKTVRFPRRFR